LTLTGKHCTAISLYVCLLLALLGVVTLIAATRWGIGVTTDPAKFMDAARNLSNGYGLVLRDSGEARPLTHHPPLYPVLLAVPGFFEIDPLDAARWLHGILLGLNTLWVVLVVRRIAPGAFWPPILGALLMLFSTTILNLHTVAFTEPLFLAWGFGGLGVLAAVQEWTSRAKPGSKHMIWGEAHPLFSSPMGWGGSAVLVALALLTRYAGMAFVITGGLGIVLWSPGSFRRRVSRAALWGIIAVLPLSIWLGRNMLIAGNATNRRLDIHPVTWERLESGLSTISAWLLPWLAWDGLRALILLTVIVGWVVWGRKYVSCTVLKGVPSLVRLLVLFIPIYIGFLLLSISLFDFETPLDSRLLSPVYMAGLVVALWTAHRVLAAFPDHRGLRRMMAVIAAAFVLHALLTGLSYLSRVYDEGQGYTGRAWQESRLVAEIRALPPDILIYTNGPDAVHAVTGRPALRIPAEVMGGTLEPNATYAAELAEMRSQLIHEEGVLVYFRSITWRWYLPTEAELAAQLPLQVVADAPDGTIYRVRGSESP